MLKKRKLRHTTGFALGMVGAVVTCIGGMLMAIYQTPVPWVQMAGLALYGGMLLVLGLLEKGPAKKGLRTKLLLLFFALVVANLNLPPLDWLWLCVTPGLFALYRQKGDAGWIAGLLLAEALSAAARILALTPLLGTNGQRAVGAALVVTSVVRFCAFWVLYRRAAARPNDANDEVHQLR